MQNASKSSVSALGRQRRVHVCSVDRALEGRIGEHHVVGPLLGEGLGKSVRVTKIRSGDTVEHDGYSLDDKRQKVAENDLPDVLDCWSNRHDTKFQQKRAQRLADLQKQIAPLKKDRLEHHSIIHRLKFEEVVSKPPDAARDAREKAEAELADLQFRMKPLQMEINQLTRQFWVTKDQVKANKYDLSASRYRQVEQDEEFYEESKITLQRLGELEAAEANEVAALKEALREV